MHKQRKAEAEEAAAAHEQPPARRSGDEGILLEEEGEIELSSLRGSLALSLSGGAHASPLSARAT